MTQRLCSTETTSDPEGSIFLPKDRLRKEFLSLEGDPYEILDQLRQATDTGLEQLYDALQFSLLQSRGTEQLDREVPDDIFARQMEQRVYFYAALKQAIGGVALSRTA